MSLHIHEEVGSLPHGSIHPVDARNPSIQLGRREVGDAGEVAS
jgi:hypothetical protein